MALRPSILASLVVAFTATNASADWKTNVEYISTPKRSGIRIISTSGDLRVNVAGASDSTPYVSSTSERDAYVPIEITDPGGHRYTTKLEVRRGYETKLSIGWVQTVKSFTGTLSNTTDACTGGNGGWPLKFALGGKTYDVSPGQRSELAFPEGKYPVVVTVLKQGAWGPATKGEVRVDHKGWSFGWGCNAMFTLERRSVTKGDAIRVNFANAIPSTSWNYTLYLGSRYMTSVKRGSRTASIATTDVSPGNYFVVLKMTPVTPGGEDPYRTQVVYQTAVTVK